MIFISSFKDILEASKSIRDLDLLLEQEEIDEQTYKDSIELISETIKDNIDELTRYNIKLQSQINECQLYKKQVEDHKKKLENKLKKLNDFIIYAMSINNKDKISGSTSEIKITTSKYVDIKDMSLIPKEYIIEDIKYNVDKNKIKDYLKTGNKIDGVTLEVRKNISIK